MRHCVRSRLEELRADYADTTGQPFAHFYCPILFRDEDVQLCQAHLINRVFPDTAQDWTVQRRDVDSFYGSRFEADFIAILYHEDGSPQEVLTDRTLSRRFRPRLRVDGELVEHFIANGEVPRDSTPVELHQNGRSVSLGLKMPPEGLTGGEHELEIEIAKDVRIAALVSLIKAAHLTLFDMLGYRYALSAGGYFVGRMILGEFFHQNHHKRKAEVLESAHDFFREFKHMVRPVESLDFDLQGTITDNKLFVCRTNGGPAWALVVFVRTSRSLHAVMIPVIDKTDTVIRFLAFLQNEDETVTGSFGRFEGGHWEIGKELGKLNWPKTGVLYPG